MPLKRAVFLMMIKSGKNRRVGRLIDMMLLIPTLITIPLTIVIALIHKSNDEAKCTQSRTPA